MSFSSSVSRLAVVLCGLGLGACASGSQNVVPPPPVRYAEPTPETAPGPEAEPTDEVVGPRFGGNGGAPSRVRCPVANGFHGQSGEFIDRVGLVCFVEAQVWNSPAYGGTGGGSFQKLCPPGARAVGIVGHSGEYIDELGLRCSNSAGEPSATERLGGPGGGDFEWTCPAGMALIGLDLTTGKFVDSVAPVCARR